VRAQKRRLQHRRVERAKLDMEPRSAWLGAVANSGQGQIGGALHRPVRKRHRVPAHSAALQVKHGLGEFHVVGQVVGFPVGIVQGHGSLDAVGRGQRRNRGAGFCGWGRTAERKPLRGHPGPLGGQIHRDGLAGQRVERRNLRDSGHMRQLPGPGNGSLAAHRDLVAGERQPR